MNAESAKSVSRGVGRDMAPEAIARRLDIAGQLHELARCLSKTRRIGPVERESRVVDDAPIEREE